MTQDIHFVFRPSDFGLQKAVHFFPHTSYLLLQNTPTGQGTWLGLSLSYDIIKAHSGELRVESKEEEGTVFAIMLNLSN